MGTLFWLTELAAMKDFFIALCITSCLVFIGMCVIYAVEIDESYNDNSERLNRLRKHLIRSSIAFITSLSFACFIPGRQDLFIIYGIGGTINYLKQNDKAQELPDKVLNALDKFVDSINKEEK